jgi:hypothetical protein
MSMGITLIPIVLLNVLLLCVGAGIGFVAGPWFCLKSSYARHALTQAIQEEMDEKGVEMVQVKPTRRMPWEGDDTTFNVVRRNTDDGQG